MSDILLDFSTNNIINAIDENLFSYISNIGKLPKAELCDEAKIKWVFSDIPHLLFNNIVRAQIKSEELDVSILSIIEKAKSRNIPMLWWTSPSTLPVDLGKRLVEHGFVDDGQIPGMAIDLANLNDDFRVPTGLTIRKVKDSQSMRQWSEIFAQGFGLPDFVAEATYNVMGYVDSNTTIAYLGWLNDKPVATSLLVLAAGVAGIYNVTTIPSARRQGIGTVITLAGLQEAKIRGYKIGVLEATIMGVSMYRTLGFQEFCQIGAFIWSP
jgi:GNAT superfamily N-acetyltransferase